MAKPTEHKCPGCEERKAEERKTFGFASYVKAKTSGKVDEHVRAMRMGACENCEEVARGDVGAKTQPGTKLFREIDGTPYCGQPHGLIDRRNEVADGCGCDLTDKVRWNKSECPRGHWGPGKRFGNQFMPLIYEVDADESRTLKDVIDVYLPSSGKHADMTGIGDTIAMGPIVQAYAKKMVADGYQVRFCVPWGRVDWARLATPNLEVDNLSDPDRMFGVMGHHSSDMRFFELDETARQQGTTRIGYFAKRFGVDLDEAMASYEVVIAQESLDEFNNDGKMCKAKENGQPIIGIAPFSHNPLRTWPLRHWVKLAYILRELFKAMVVVIDGKGLEERTKPFPCTRWHGLDPNDSAALITNLDLMIGNDSGMTHLGGFLKVPTIALCGITDGDIVFGSYPSVSVMQAKGNCTGCLWFQENGFKPWCMEGCNLLEDLKPELVVERVGALLATQDRATA